MTLFGNILQNPLDPRARSDTRLMNLVVTFLSMLGQEAESGGVHRMLGVCSEFERIAKVVIDKAEKDSHGRRKRKSHDPSPSKPISSTASSLMPPRSVSQTPRPATASTPKPPLSVSSSHASPSTMNGHGSNGQLSPSLPGEHEGGFKSGFAPVASSMSHNPSPAPAPAAWQSDYSTGIAAADANFSSFVDLSQFGGFRSSPLANLGGTFQQPLLPQDLFSSMTLDWDWAEVSGGAYPSFENGAIAKPEPGS